jgi:hypothetical protein
MFILAVKIKSRSALNHAYRNSSPFMELKVLLTTYCHWKEAMP